MVSQALLGTGIVVGLFLSAAVVRLLDPFAYLPDPSETDEEPVEEWYEGTESLAIDVEETWEETYEDPIEAGRDPDYDEVKAAFDRLATDLDGHLSAAHRYDVDPHVLKLTAKTVAKCRRLADLSLFLAEHGEFERRGNEAAATAVDLQNEIRMVR